MRIINAVKRLWRLATCDHRGAANWTLTVADLEVTGAVVEAHFCRRCGRLLMAVKESDQPQYNQHWLESDCLDDPRLRAVIYPMDRHLHALAFPTRPGGEP